MGISPSTVYPINHLYCVPGFNRHFMSLSFHLCFPDPRDALAPAFPNVKFFQCLTHRKGSFISAVGICRTRFVAN